MATSPRTPRKKTPEEKAAHDAKYKTDVKGFGQYLKQMTIRFNALTALNTALGQAGKGAFLAYPNPNQPKDQYPPVFIPFNRKHLRSANAKFAREILELKNFLRVARKKERAPSTPESFSGTYTPVYAAPALLAYFTNGAAGFGNVQPGNAASGLLMESLQMVRQGYLLRNTSTMLFYIYAHAQGLQDAANAQYARSDDLMNQVFGGQIPAAYYSWKVETGKTKSAKVRQPDGSVVMVDVPAVKSEKLAMDQAVAVGRAPAPLNTYDVIRSSYPDFNPAHFNTYFYQNIAAANYYSRAALAASGNADLQAVAQALNMTEVRQAMLAEHQLVKQVSDSWHAVLEPGRKVQRDARKKQADAAKKARKAAGY
jgi:hypothetical protein